MGPLSIVLYAVFGYTAAAKAGLVLPLVMTPTALVLTSLYLILAVG